MVKVEAYCPTCRYVYCIAYSRYWRKSTKTDIMWDSSVRDPISFRIFWGQEQHKTTQSVAMPFLQVRWRLQQQLQQRQWQRQQRQEQQGTRNRKTGTGVTPRPLKLWYTNVAETTCQVITKNVSGFEVRTLSAQVPSTTALLDLHNTCKIWTIPKMAIVSTCSEISCIYIEFKGIPTHVHPHAAKRIKMNCIELLVNCSVLMLDCWPYTASKAQRTTKYNSNHHIASNTHQALFWFVLAHKRPAVWRILRLKQVDSNSLIATATND